MACHDMTNHRNTKIPHGVQYWGEVCIKKSYCLVANLNQNPGHRPIISMWLPALLKAGCMWLIARGPDEATEASCSDVTEEMIEVLVQWWSVLNYVGVFLVSWANVISFHLLRPQPQSCVMCHGSCSGITPVHHQCCNGICPGALECSRSTDVARAISNRSVSNLFSCIATYGGQTHCWKCDIAAGRVVHTYIYIPEPGPGPNLTHHKPMVSPYH